jgi:hypothetical protein
MPVRFALVALGTVQEPHAVLDLLDVRVELGHAIVVAIDGRGEFTARCG